MEFNYILPKTDIKHYGVNGALLLAELKSKYKYFSDAGMVNDNDEFFTTLQELQYNTGLGINTIKRLIPKLSPAVEYTVRKDRVTKHTKEQLTYYFKFSTQNPFGLVTDQQSLYVSSIAGVMTNDGYRFLLNPVPTENINVIMKLFDADFNPREVSENHMMGKIHTLEQIEAIYEIYYK